MSLWCLVTSKVLEQSLHEAGYQHRCCDLRRANRPLATSRPRILPDAAVATMACFVVRSIRVPTQGADEQNFCRFYPAARHFIAPFSSVLHGLFFFWSQTNLGAIGCIPPSRSRLLAVHVPPVTSVWCQVMTKYVTAPLVFPGSPEWGMMLNVKEDLAKDLPLN